MRSNELKKEPVIEPGMAELRDEIRRLNELLVRQMAQQRDWRLAMRNGLLAGLGGVLGATVVVSVLIALLQPFKKLEMIGPMFDRLDSTLRQPVRR